MIRIFLSLLLLQSIIAVYAGSCNYGDPLAPVYVMVTGTTRATIGGAGVQINPITDIATGAYLENEYIRSEVAVMRELLPVTPGGDCIGALDMEAINDPYLKNLNLSLCDCTHTPGTDYFPDGTTRRDFVRVNVSCSDFASTLMLLDISVVDAPYNVSHPMKNDTSNFAYDRYRPDEIKFNVTVENWPWSDDLETYGAIFVATTVNVRDAYLSTNTTTEEMVALIENDHVRFYEGIQRGFTFDGLSYITPIAPSSTDPFIVAPNFQLVNGIALCWLRKPIPERPYRVTYDPTLSTLFFGEPPQQGAPEKKKDNNLALKVALPVILCTVALVGIFAVVVYNTPALKNFFRPFRNSDKDGALV